MQSSSDYLLGVTYQPRVFAWLLAFAVLTVASLQVAEPGQIWFMLFVCAAYPHILQWVLKRFRVSATGIRRCLLLDCFLVGLLIGLIGYSPSATVVLTVLLLVSVVIVCGFSLLLIGAPVLVSGSILANWLTSPPDNINLDEVSFACLVFYAGFVAWLVYRETRRLNAVHRREFSLRHHLENLRERLAPFTAPQLIRRTLTTGDPVQRKKLTVLFSDIEGFTHLMDTENESEVAEWLNGYFEAMTRVAEVYGGTVDKFLGDGVMVFFGDPESGGAIADAHACVAMALDMKQRFRQLAGNWRTGRTLHIRIGIHTGYCLVGSFGFAQRMDYTALGSTVNRASRIEGKARQNEILISEDTYQLLEPWVSAEVRGRIRLKGIGTPVGVYAVNGLSSRANKTYSAGRVRLLS